MPIVSCDQGLLEKRLGKAYNKEDFEKLCFAYGIELDDVVEEERFVAGDDLAEDVDDLDLLQRVRLLAVEVREEVALVAVLQHLVDVVLRLEEVDLAHQVLVNHALHHLELSLDEL